MYCCWSEDIFSEICLGTKMPAPSACKWEVNNPNPGHQRERALGQRTDWLNRRKQLLFRLLRSDGCTFSVQQGAFAFLPQGVFVPWRLKADVGPCSRRWGCQRLAFAQGGEEVSHFRGLLQQFPDKQVTLEVPEQASAQFGGWPWFCKTSAALLCLWPLWEPPFSSSKKGNWFVIYPRVLTWAHPSSLQAAHHTFKVKHWILPQAIPRIVELPISSLSDISEISRYKLSHLFI